MSQRRLVVFFIVLAAVVPYLPTLDDYFVQDDFGVVSLLASKPASFFPRWFVIPWMENIWGEPPDELRPFPAVTYQIAALSGAASPVANHVINIGFHAVNAFLVFRIAEAAAGLALGPAAFAAVVFAVLPMQTESVAWITGRVDSMPACLYLLSFLLFAIWRATPNPSTYVWSVVVFFTALFTKQNAVTLPVALVLYDLLIVRRAVRVSWEWLRPYVPFALLTVGYLALRYAIFGEVAREGRLDASGVELFLQNASIHLRRMVFGEPGLRRTGLDVALRVGGGMAVVGLVQAVLGERKRIKVLLPSLYFLVVWIALGLAPTIVAGYGSPRHMYLASVGWALWLGISLAVFWNARPRPVLQTAGVVLAVGVSVAYALQLRQEVGLWAVRSAVSHQIVVDLEREAAVAPPGTLIIVDPPQRSWNFALPFAVRPPFASSDLTARVSFISHSSIHCCPAYLWDEYTRKTMRAWMANPGHPPVMALRWDSDTGEMFRQRDADSAFLRTVVPLLLEARDVTALDRLLLNVSDGLAVNGP